jgi:hypothetical protein
MIHAWGRWFHLLTRAAGGWRRGGARAILGRMNRQRRRDRVRARAVVFALGALTAFTLVGRRLGYKFGTNTIVRCRQGHLFTTIWIPGVKLKAVDLGVARLQRCPVGDHWSLVTPVRDARLTDRERARAREHRDIRIP